MARTSRNKAWKRERKSGFLLQKEYQYFIFCEGQQTEPNYFKGFQELIDDNPIYRDMVSVVIEPVGGETLYVMQQAEDYVSDNNIQKGQIWCVYDKDSFPKARFDGVVERAKLLNKQNQNIQYHCAWSNQCVELWFILHFSFYQADNDRTLYIQYLNREFQKRGIGKYEKNMKGIFNILLEQGNPALAIRYAKKLIAGKEDLKPSEVEPGTMVYRLVEELSGYLPVEIRVRFE